MAEIIYENEGTIEEADLNLNLLQISLKHKIPHVHACGGNGKCSTCRVMILEYAGNVLPRGDNEQKIASRKGLEENIRLACQTHINGPVKLRRLVLDDEDTIEASAYEGRSTGREQKLAILFSDIRNFSQFTEQNLPYDVVHTLNRYFHKMGDSIKRHQGFIDKYLGDGIMALFGMDTDDHEEACMQAVNAGLSMLDNLREVNSYLAKQLSGEFRVGIGIHFGEVIAGELGHPVNRQFTAIGNNVNIASRIEAATKKSGANLLVSEELLENVRDKVILGRSFQVKLRAGAEARRLHEITSVNEEIVMLAREQKISASGQYHEFLLKEKHFKGDDTLIFRLDTQGEEFEHRAGQHVEVIIPGSNDNSRFFSIASAGHISNSLFFATHMRMSPFKEALSKLEPGTPVRVSAPRGEFQLPDRRPGPVVFVAGGIGITPVRSIIEELAYRDERGMAEDRTNPIFLFYSSRNPSQALFLKDFEKWADQMPYFYFIPSVTRRVDGTWKYDTGRVTGTTLRLHVGDLTWAHYYVVGSHPMVTGIQDILHDGGVSADQIVTEKFSGY